MTWISVLTMAGEVWGLAEVRAIIKKCLSETANRQAGNQSFHLFQSFHVHVCLEGHGASL